MKRILILAAFMAVFTAQAAEYGNNEAVVLRVYDGDTLTVSIPGWPAVVGQKIPVRVLGIDTPEMHGKCPAEKEKALAAKRHTAAFVQAGKVELRHIQRGKYFRLLADVIVDGYSLSQSLIDAGLAYPYFGGTKQSWCNLD